MGSQTEAAGQIVTGTVAKLMTPSTPENPVRYTVYLPGISYVGWSSRFSVIPGKCFLAEFSHSDVSGARKREIADYESTWGPTEELVAQVFPND